jgi:DNA-binding NarL/FixJ family response regulator
MRLLLVDDDADFRRLARQLLQDGGYDVVGAAANARDAVRMAGEHAPDVTLVDVTLPDANGFELATRLAREHPGMAVLLISTYDRGDVDQLVRATGARGFVPKDELSAPELDRRLA